MPDIRWRAAQRVPVWPWKRARPGRKMSPVAEQHIAGEWEFARRTALASVSTLLSQSLGNEQAALGQVDLVFITRIAAHVVTCDKCGRRWVDGEVPTDVLRWALARIPAGRLLKIFEIELEARRRAAA